MVKDFEDQPAHSTRKAISYRQVVDLSRAIRPSMPRWPGDPPIRFRAVARLDPDGYFLRRFSMGEHTGTHMNAPVSFHRHGESIDAYPAESLVAPAVVIDVRAGAEADADYALDAATVLHWERQHGEISPGSIVLLHTAWQAEWRHPEESSGSSNRTGLHFPGFGIQAARFLLNEREIAGGGPDTPGVEPGRDKAYSINRMMLEKRRIVLEYLANLGSLPPTGSTLVIGILRLKGGSGSPASVLAFVP
ncbi:MAG: cyclase family protein [Chloroflexota bacterium]